MSKFITYTTYAIFLIWSVFALQFFKDNPTIATTMLLLLLEIISVIVVLLNLKDLFSSKLNVLVFAWTVYALLNAFVTSTDLFVDVRVTLWWPSMYFLFYFIAFVDPDDKNVRTIIKLFPVLFVVLLLEYLSIRATNIFRFTESGRVMYESSNGIYFNALLLPFAFLLKNKRSKYFFLLVGLVLVLLSFKRSALIYSVLVIMMALYFDYIATKNMNLIKGLLLSGTIIAVGLLAFKYVDDKTGGFVTQRFESMSEDKGSGRTEIYKNVWKIFQEKSFEYQAIGSGLNSVIRDNAIHYGSGEVEHISAHNDFLEILYDFGIIGLIIYLMLIVGLVKRLLYLRRMDEKFFQANLAGFIIFIVMSMVSHLVIFPNYFAYLVILWAITEGMIRRKGVLIA